MEPMLQRRQLPSTTNASALDQATTPPSPRLLKMSSEPTGQTSKEVQQPVFTTPTTTIWVKALIGAGALNLALYFTPVDLPIPTWLSARLGSEVISWFNYVYSNTLIPLGRLAIALIIGWVVVILARSSNPDQAGRYSYPQKQTHRRHYRLAFKVSGWHDWPTLLRNYGWLALVMGTAQGVKLVQHLIDHATTTNAETASASLPSLVGLGAPAGLGLGLALIKAFCVAIGEEFFFRGLIQTGLNALPALGNKKLAGINRGTILAALIFSLAHLPNLAYQPAGYVLVQLATALVFGVLYGWCYERSGNLWGAVYLHTFWDWAVIGF